MSELVSVTIRLERAEFVINPRLQTVRATELDGLGCPMGATEEININAAIGEMRGMLEKRRPEARDATR